VPPPDERPVAVIEIGSSAIHLTVAQATRGDTPAWNVVEDLTRGIRISKDAVSQGAISRETVDEVLSVLKLWKRTCEANDVARIRTVVTSGVLEASNAEIFLDNLRTFAGLDPEPLSTIQETAWLYLALRGREGAPGRVGPQAMLKVGAATSLLTVFDSSLILAQITLPLGLVRMRQIFESLPQREMDFGAYLEASIDHELRLMEDALPVRRVEQVYGFGNELEAMRSAMGFKAGDPPFARERLGPFLDGVAELGRDGLCRRHGVPYDLTEHFHPAGRILDRVAAWFDCRTVELAPVTLRDGLVPEFHQGGPGPEDLARRERQLHADALAVGRAFRFDERHASSVAEYSLTLFDLTQDVHRLGPRERQWLMAAALLHDVGYAISYNAHHKHSHYIIQSRDFFYLSDAERSIIALAARYHRKAGPKATHVEFENLSRADRMTVLKLASMLRIAEALDYSRDHRVAALHARREPGRIVLCCTIADQIFGEIYSFNDKKELFEELFGLRLSIETAPHPEAAP